MTESTEPIELTKAQIYQREYYKKNRERIQQMFKETMYCKSCKKEVNRHNYRRHKKSNIHIANRAKRKKRTEKNNSEDLEKAVTKALAKLLKQQENNI